MRIFKSRYFLYFFSLIFLVLAFFGIRKELEDRKTTDVADSELIAKGEGHHGGHHGGHGHHRGHHHRHIGHRFQHDHNNNWWHHNNHPGWNHNNGHQPLHNWYWYGASGVGGAAAATALTHGWGDKPGYTYDPNYYYETNGSPSIEYEYDQTQPSSAIINVEQVPSSNQQPVGQFTSANDKLKKDASFSIKDPGDREDEDDNEDDSDYDDEDDSEDDDEDDSRRREDKLDPKTYESKKSDNKTSLV